MHFDRHLVSWPIVEDFEKTYKLNIQFPAFILWVLEFLSEENILAKT